MVFNRNFDRDRTPVNHGIRAQSVLCIDSENNNLGVLQLSEAIRLANEAELDLVQVGGGNPPTCRIMNYSKYKYEQSKNKKASEKKERENRIETKQIKFHPSTGMHDLAIKAKKTQEFLDEGDQVQVSIIFKNKRQTSHREVADNTLNEFLGMLTNVSVKGLPSFDGRTISISLVKSVPEK